MSPSSGIKTEDEKPVKDEDEKYRVSPSNNKSQTYVTVKNEACLKVEYTLEAASNLGKNHAEDDRTAKVESKDERKSCIPVFNEDYDPNDIRNHSTPPPSIPQPPPPIPEDIPPSPPPQEPVDLSSHRQTVKLEPMDVDIDLSHPPPKKRRLTFVIEVPSLESVLKQYQNLRKMHNPKIKKIKNDMVISLDAFTTRLEALGGPDLYHVELSSDIRDVEVSRYLISHLYGGGPQETFPRPNAKFIAKHGIQDFMCLNYILHPNGPKFPGSRGFYFTVADGVHAKGAKPWTDIFRLIMQYDASKWQYLGQYAMFASESLSKEEWLAQSNAFRRCWISEIMRRQWGLHVRARIALRRRLGRIPTLEDLENDGRTIVDLAKEVSEEDIYAAFASGDMFIAVWGMKCVGYDVAFQTHLATSKPAWELARKQRASEGGSNKKPRKTKKKGPAETPKKGKRKQRDTTSSSEDDHPGAIQLDDDDDEVEEVHSAVVYKPRGTRSRPMAGEVISVD